jgi:cell division protein FtsB
MPSEQATRTTVSRASKRPWMRLRYIAVIVVCGWAFYHYLHVQQPQLAQLNAKQTQLQGQLSTLQKQRDQLTKESQQLQNNTFIARYASQHYNLILPGQVAFDVKN